VVCLQSGCNNTEQPARTKYTDHFFNGHPEKFYMLESLTGDDNVIAFVFDLGLAVRIADSYIHIGACFHVQTYVFSFC
jgi:hypothetical protein